MILGSISATHARLPVRSPYAPLRSEAAAPCDTVTLSAASTAADSTPAASPAKRAALLGLGALSLFGAFVATTPAFADVGPPPGVSRVAANPEVVKATRGYIDDMIENNRIQGETLNTYPKTFQNNYNTLVRIEQRILANPQSLADPNIRSIYDKVQASLDAVQVFPDKTEDVTYQAGGERVIQTPDGTRITIPEPSVQRTPRRLDDDYSGAARMTDRTIDRIHGILHPEKK